MSEGKKLWGGRFKAPADAHFAGFNNSFAFDVRLLEADVEASRAYCGALLRAAVITSEDAAAIHRGLETILQKSQSDPAYLLGTDVEDVHSFVEARLVELIGEAGKRLHTGRSRNDQVSTDFRLWVRKAIDSLHDQSRDTQTALLEFAEENRAVV
ncbi:MAG TPA: lyase family protein, partial [Pyrinomonadaceae bacterium]